jgi:type IV secretion system protein VirD4
MAMNQALYDGVSPAIPENIWETNGGLYLGLVPEGGTDQKTPLAGKETEPSVPRGARFRSTWQPDGTLNLFTGEGHVTVIGPQGSGKTRKLLMVNLFKLRDWSAVVIDTKGGLCAHTALWRAAQEGHKVFVVDPFEVMKNNYPGLYEQRPDIFKSCGFNPLAVPYRSKDLAVDEVKALAMALIHTDDSRDPYWPMAAQALAKGLAMALKVDRPGQSDNLCQLRSMLSMRAEDLAKAIDYLINQHGDNWPAIRAALNEFAKHNADDREIGGIRRTAIAQTDWLDSPLMQRDLSPSQNKIDFASLKQTPTTVYLILPPEQLETHGVWLRMMVTSALRPLLRSAERAPVPVLFMLDEFAALGRMPFIEKNQAQFREYGAKLLTVWQHLPQMQRLYKDGWEDFMATSDIKVTFTANDANTREYFSKLGGERLFTHTTTSNSTSFSQGNNTGTSDNFSRGHGLDNMSKGGGNSSGTSWNASRSDTTSEQRINERCVKPYELAALDADEALIYARRGKMFRAICPQPEVLPGIQDAITAARAVIDGGNIRRIV